MHRVNAGFTLLLPIRDGQVEATSTLLAELHRDQARLPFARSTTTFFATITIIPAQTYGTDYPLPATLLFATSYCGPTRVHVQELVRELGPGLREVLRHCDDFEPGCSDAQLATWLLRRRHGDTFYSGMNHTSPQCVQRHRELRDAIEAYIDERQARGDLPESATEIRQQIREHVSARPELAWVNERWKPTLGAWLLFNRRALIIEAGAGALLAATLSCFFVDSTLLRVVVWTGWIAVILFVLFLGFCLFTIHDAEAEQTYFSRRPPDKRARELAAAQNRLVINEFTLGGPIKPEGKLRPIFLRIALWVIGRVFDGVPGMPYVGTGISIPTVATARWIVTNGGRRLLFISNYTNAGEAYVRDFIETPAGAKRINLAFGFGTGYPKTEWIFREGAHTDPNTYLYSLAENTLPTLFWYGPYHDISIDNIKVNRQIREGLFDDKLDAQKWLHLL